MIPSALSECKYKALVDGSCGLRVLIVLLLPTELVRKLPTLKSWCPGRKTQLLFSLSACVAMSGSSYLMAWCRLSLASALGKRQMCFSPKRKLQLAISGLLCGEKSKHEKKNLQTCLQSGQWVKCLWTGVAWRSRELVPV